MEHPFACPNVFLGLSLWADCCCAEDAVVCIFGIELDLVGLLCVLDERDMGELGLELIGHHVCYGLVEQFRKEFHGV